MEGIYLVGVTSCASMLSQVAFVDAFGGLQLIPPCSCSSLELIRHKFDLFLLENISNVKEFIYLVDLIHKGFNIMIPTERGNANIHLVLMRIWVSSFPTMIRATDSSLPVGVRISESLTPSID